MSWGEVRRSQAIWKESLCVVLKGGKCEKHKSKESKFLKNALDFFKAANI